MRRSRAFVVLLTSLLLLASFLPVASADDWRLNSADLATTNITIDGQPQSFKGYIVNDRTVVPLRAIFESLGAKIEWNPDTWTVTATKGSRVIVLTVGKTAGTIDNQEYTLSVPPVLIDGRTYVPVRFIIDALGLQITWDADTYTVMISTGTGCTRPGPTVHEGTISPGGETWDICGAPHIVAGTFSVEGKDSPILTIAKGTLVRFESDARIEVGADAPGGLVVNGTATDPVYFTADTTGPQAGFWGGIRFFNQALINDSRIAGAVIEYAGEDRWGAITIEGYGKMVEVQLNDVTISKSLYAGLKLSDQGRLRAGSAGLKITDTVQAGSEGGFPIVTAVLGSHNLPRGEFKNNAINAVNILEESLSTATVAANTTWRNIGMPYAISQDVRVEGNTTPTLTIEPGVITLWSAETGLIVGENGPGYLVADALVEKSELDLGLSLATAASIEPGCALCAKNRAIVFGAWNAMPGRGAWNGVQLMSNTGDKSRLVGVVIGYGGKNEGYSAGLYVESGEGKAVKFLLAKSLIAGAARSGMEFYGNVQLHPESTGNYFIQNGWPIRMHADYIGYLPSGQTFGDNDKQVISVGNDGSSDVITKTATWRNHGIPYRIEATIYIGGNASPVLTIEPGTKLLFQKETGLVAGSSEGMGSLVAVGTAGKPITFTAEAARKGGWNGIHISSDAGADNRLEMVVIEYATIGVTVDDDLGGFIKNSTIRGSSETGIYRSYGSDGTSFLTGLGNQFEGNAEDENEW